MTKDFLAEFEFQLSAPISVHDKGQIIEAKALRLKPPSARNRVQTAKLKQAFYRGMTSLQSKIVDKGDKEKDKEVAPENQEIKGADIINMILASDTDYGEFTDQFRVLLLTDCAFVAGSEQKLTQPLYDQISDRDLDLLMGDYFENFILGSSNRD